MNEAFSLWNLFPNFEEFFAGNLHSAEWLTALFILGLLAAFIISLFYALTKCVSSASVGSRIILTGISSLF